MLIANPIYDSVFKHLMEDKEIASGLISRLLGFDVVSIEVRPQESSHLVSVNTSKGRSAARIYRIDFAATIRDAEGNLKKVLVELQKAQTSTVLERFRFYLGQNYSMPAKQHPLTPIIPIYLLGYELDEALPKVLRVDRSYTNGVTGEKLDPRPNCEFVDCLTNDAVVVQITKIDDSADSELERLLQVFDQRRMGDDRHFLVLNDKLIEASDALLARMVRRLAVAAADEETQMQMRLEDELAAMCDDIDAAKLATQEAKKQAEEAKKRAKEAKKQAKEAALKKDEAVQQKEEAVQQKAEAVQQKDEAVQQKDEAVQQKDVAVQQKDVAVQQKDEALRREAEALGQLAELRRQLAESKKG